MAYVAIADRDHEHDLHDPQTFITKYVWSQDHKVIAIQYSLTAIFVGWKWGIARAREDIEKHETKFHWAKQWGFLIRYITPVAVAFVFFAKFF